MCIGDDADTTTMAEFVADPRYAKKLRGLCFSEFFKWLSASLVAVTTRSQPGAAPGATKLPEADGWLEY